MNLKHDDDELNFTIHQPSLYGQTVIKPLTVRAIIDHITKRQRGARTPSDAERSFLAKFGAAKDDPGGFIENSFLDAAFDGGKTIREESFQLGTKLDEDSGSRHPSLSRPVCCQLDARGTEFLGTLCQKEKS